MGVRIKTNLWNHQLSNVFFCVVAPIHWETDLREAYASLRGVKGSLRGGVLFGVASPGGYARIFSPAGLKKSALRQLWLLSRYLAFCGFISFHFGLLWLHFVSFWPFVTSTKVFGLRCYGSNGCFFHSSGDLWLGLSVAYAGLTRRLRSAYAGGAGSFWQT